ncbi:MAG TPA: TonB-dependent receptor plug domain-containing protein, partial [Chitinophagaceae bacterium]
MRKLLLLSCLCFAIAIVQAQTKTITGKVTDQKSGAPIGGVSVSIRGGTVGTQTKEDGSFSITVPSSTRTITFSSIGYGEIEEVIGNSTTLNIALGAGTGKRLDEVVVVAYGTQTKKEATGAVTRVSGADIENRPFTSVDKILQGQVAGLQSVAPSGQPGGIQQVRLRGIGSISASSAPLYVVDGIPINSGDLSRNTTTSNALAGINPNDIESVSVLKDAAATSLYGSRAANGVILINTRKGRPGKTRIRFDAEVGINQQAKFGDAAMPLNRDEYFTLLEEGIINAGGTQNDVNNISNAFGKNNGFDDDWFDLVTRNGMQQQFNLSASG